MLSVPVYAGAVIAVVLAVRRRERAGRGVVATLAVVSTALMVAVAAMTEAGFAGNLRYVARPPRWCILAGAGWVGLCRVPRHRRRSPPRVLGAVALAVAAPFVVDDADASSTRRWTGSTTRPTSTARTSTR